MGNTHAKPHPRTRNKKQVHWKAADRPSPPGKPHLASDNELTPDLVTIRWGKPVRDGGSPVTGYLVEHRRTGSPHWVRATPLLVPFPELTLSGLEPGWRYQFRARAENAVGLSDPGEVSEPLTVTLQKFAITSPKFTEELRDATALENDKVEFAVHFMAQPAPKVCWFKDGFEIFSSRRTRILTDSDKSVLTIHQSALADEGEIKCTATNKAGHASTKARLSLEAPPSIRLPRQYEDGLLFEIGEVLRLKVSVVGRPTPLVFWTHNGESIQNNDRYEIEYVDRCSVLKVGEAMRSDRGEYQIKAVNKIGEDVASFLVTVTDKPSPPGRARVIMTLGRSVTLSWGTPQDDGGCKIGNYIVEYYRLGWNVWLKAATSRQLTTILGDLIEGSEYKFRVKAESPYGVSDPSEESDTIFIPDAKRGITTPQARSKSQPKDLIEELASPVPTLRRKPRSQSTSTKADALPQFSQANGDIPQRPLRTKVKSPPKTPEQSPAGKRREITETILDRASIARELAYGSPEIKMKKKELGLPNASSISSSSERSHSSSPVEAKPPSPGPKTSGSPGPRPKEERRPSVSPGAGASPRERRSLPRDDSGDFRGSSEFMLVLYPDGSEKDQRRASSFGFDFDEISIPPPLSLSAPELGAEPPSFYNLKPSSSSTELLHERAMMRFHEAATLEEAQKRGQGSQQPLEIPKIQINSKDDQDIVGLDRKHSARRRLSSGGVTQQQQALWAQRRFSLKNSIDVTEMAESRLKDKRQTMMAKQRSESEEKEEEAFEKVRAKMAQQSQSSFEKRSIDVVDEEKWLEDYEESLSEEETESEEDGRPSDKEPPRYSDEEDEDVYHPGVMSVVKTTMGDEPFEILTKRNKLPDPNFVPKPILKRPDPETAKNPGSGKVRQHSPMPEERLRSLSLAQETSRAKVRPHSPIPEETTTKSHVETPRAKVRPHSPLSEGRQRSLSLAHPEVPVQPVKSNTLPTRQRSYSLTPAQEKAMKIDGGLAKVLPESMPVILGRNISAVAQLTGLTAASIVISESLLKTKEDEGAKVVADHYSDIMKSVTEKRRRSVPHAHAQTPSPLEKYSSPPKPTERRDSRTMASPGDRYSQYERAIRDTMALTPKDFDTNPDRPGDRYPEAKDYGPNPSDSYGSPPTIVDRPDDRYPLRKPTAEDYETNPFERYSPPLKPATKKDPQAKRVRNYEPDPVEPPTGRPSQPPLDQELFRAVSPPLTSPEKRYQESMRIDIVMSKQEAQRLKEQQQTSSSDSLSIQRRREKSLSPQRRSPTPQRGRSDRRLPRKASKRSKTPNKLEKWNRSPSPMKPAAAKRKSPSPIPYSRPKPMLKEIMTQTSVGLELDYSTSDSRTSSPTARQEELIARAEIKVRSFFDYATDLAMFAVACWLYLFSNELLAIPILIVMVYRQLKDEVVKRIPKWLLRRLKKKPKKKK